MQEDSSLGDKISSSGNMKEAKNSFWDLRKVKRRKKGRSPIWVATFIFIFEF